MTRTSILLGSGLLFGSAVAGCATAAPPPELINARAAYTRAEAGPAKQLSPAALHEASIALHNAEAAYQNDDDSQETRDAAYLAERKAQLADVEASTASWKHRQDDANAKANDARNSAAEKAQNQLAQTRGELTQTREKLAESETRAKDALTRLAAANAAQVKEEPRGMVITLSGSVLFESGKSALLAGAQSKLEEVATALKDQEDKHILIEGHTDSRGNDDKNLALSKSRADAVGQYLVSKGVPQDRVTTAGIGSSRPVSDNNSAEGRANNRRVEIVIQPTEPR